MQQKIYSLDEHRVHLDHIDRDALYVMEKLRHAGFIAYLVGGSVRDLLLQQRPKDFDISTSAEPEEIKKLFRNCILVGKRFRLAHIRFGRKVLEVSTFRSGDTTDESFIVRDNKWGSPEEDVLRRDFTINGLFYDSANQTIIDYVGGYEDLQKKYLRTIGQPFIRFKQDPVRMIRLLKFQARFGFDVDSQTHIALLECRNEIVKSSQARILEELLRMLESGSARPFFKLMTDHGVLGLLLPTLASFMEKEEGAEIYSYLQEVDTQFREPRTPTLHRPILLATLVFPVLQYRIQHHWVARGRHPHLGEIQNETFSLIDEIFRTFFHLPRRLRISMGSLLTAQWRLTPIEKRRARRLRIPQDPDFSLAIAFLQLRCSIEPGLQKICEEWSSAMTSDEPPPPRKRRRRRRKPSHGSDQGTA